MPLKYLSISNIISKHQILRIKMAFENAIITKEDDERYGLTNIFLKYNPSDKGLPDQWYWIIDKERYCWLMESGFFHDLEVNYRCLSRSLWRYFIVKVKSLKSY